MNVKNYLISITFLSAMSLTALTNAAENITNSSGITDGIPNLGDNGSITWISRVKGINNSTIMQFRDGQTRSISNGVGPAYFDANSSGQVAWYQPDGSYKDLFYFDGSNTVQLINNNNVLLSSGYDAHAISDTGSLVWSQYVTGGWQVKRYANGVISQVTSSASSKFTPVISNNGQYILWRDGPFGIGIWDGVSEKVIYSGTTIVSRYKVNNSGHAIWMSDYKIYYYDGVTTKVVANYGKRSFASNFTDSGKFIWSTSENEEMTASSTYLFDNGTITKIRSTGANFDYLININEAGEAVWTQFQGVLRQLVHYSNGVISELNPGGNNIQLWGSINNAGGIAWSEFMSDGTYDLFIPSSNTAPVAHAGVNQVAECTGDNTQVVLNASASTDADGDALTYAWAGSFGTAMGVSPTVALSKGTHSITLTVTDAASAISQATVSVTVSDTIAPTINGGADVVLEAEAPGGTAHDFNPVVFEACSNTVSISIAPSPALYPIGTTSVELIATDDVGLSGNGVHIRFLQVTVAFLPRRDKHQQITGQFSKNT